MIAFFCSPWQALDFYLFVSGQSSSLSLFGFCFVLFESKFEPSRKQQTWVFVSWNSCCPWITFVLKTIIDCTSLKLSEKLCAIPQSNDLEGSHQYSCWELKGFCDVQKLCQQSPYFGCFLSGLVQFPTTITLYLTV